MPLLKTVLIMLLKNPPGQSVLFRQVKNASRQPGKRNEKLENHNAVGNRGTIADYQLSKPHTDSASNAFLESTDLSGDPASIDVVDRICHRIFYTQETGLR